jgi:signal transduction histidine kinase
MRDQPFHSHATIFNSTDLRSLPPLGIPRGGSPEMIVGVRKHGVSRIRRYLDVTTRDDDDLHGRKRLDDLIGGVSEIGSLYLQSSELTHDLNNLFQISMSALSLIAIRIEQGRQSEVPGLLEKAELSLERASAVTKRMAALPFVASDVRPVDINASVAGMHGLFSLLAGSNIDVQLRLTPCEPLARCDKYALENALLNLMTNARNAIEDCGTIEISTSIESRRLAGPSEVPRQYVAVKVSDSGHGMSEEVASKVFDAFYSTRRSSGGTGLGLAAVRRFLDDSEGQSEIESVVGYGTAVSLFLPICTEALLIEGRHS